MVEEVVEVVVEDEGKGKEHEQRLSPDQLEEPQGLEVAS